MKALELLAALVAALGLGCAAAPPAAAPPSSGSATGGGATGELRIRFLGLTPDRGSLSCAVYADPAAFDGEGPARRSATLPVVGDGVEWRVELPRGAYAVKAYQDLDGDGELDRGPLGVPSEPYGFSNDARGAFGPPSWRAARFVLDRPSLELEIRLE